MPDFFNPIYPRSDQDVWNNLMAFGMQTMAAGGVPGATTLGALGQGGVAAMQQSRENQLARANTNYLNEDMRQKQIANMMAMNKLSLASQMLGLPMPGGMGAPGMTNGVQPPDASTQAPPINAGGQPWAPTVGQALPTIQNSAQPQHSAGGGNNVLGTPQGFDPTYWRQGMAYDFLGIPEAAKNAYTAASTPVIESQKAWAGVPANLYAQQNAPQRVEGKDPRTGAPNVSWTTPSQAMGGMEAPGMLQPVAPMAPLPGAVPQRQASFVQPSPQEVAAANMNVDQVAAALPGRVLGAEETSGIPISAEGDGSYTAPQGLTTGPSATREKILKEGGLGEDADKEYEATKTALAQTAYIKSALDNLKSAGMLTTGSGGEARAGFAKAINTFQKVIGVDDDSLLYKPEDVATAEGLYKTTTNLGFNLARTMGAKEAASVVQQAVSINPGLANTPLGGELVNNLVTEMAQMKKDNYEYALDRGYNNDVPKAIAGREFSKKYPGDAYVKRAVSQVEPIQIPQNRASARDQLLPGTWYRVKLSDGNLTTPRIVPVPENYQFSLPPTVNESWNR